jgi:hypothetical protein
MTERFEKAMRNLRDSLANVKEHDIEGKWCYVRPNELEALIMCANEMNRISTKHRIFMPLCLKMLEVCADE